MSIGIFASICLATLASPALTARVHIIPHSHMDMGWLSTIQDYFDYPVASIFKTVMETLAKTLDDEKVRVKRRYTINDLGFFRMWLDSDPETRDDKIKTANRLIEAGVLEVVGTGIVMADTACPHYEDFINNFFEGIAFTERTFKVRSQVLWQLDSFGQSAGLFYVASLFGMQDAVFHRIHQVLRERMGQEGVVEFVWQLPLNQTINVHLNQNYAWLNEMDMSVSLDLDPQRLQDFLENQSRGFQGDSYVMLGSDFTYSNADKQFNILETAFDAFEWSGYSSMADYLDAFYAKDIPWPVFSGDFLPYIDYEGTFDSWTGYFTTKPTLKHKIRRIQKIQRGLAVWTSCFTAYSSYPQPASQANIETVRELASKVSLFLHHDAITGTALRKVDTDYFIRLADLENELAGVFGQINGVASFGCDPHTDFLGLSNCFMLTEYLKTSYAAELTILNPSGRRLQRRVQLSVPRWAVRNYLALYVGYEKPVPVQTVCFEGRSMCLVDAEVELTAANGYRRFWLLSRDETLTYYNLRGNDWSQDFEIDDPDAFKVPNVNPTDYYRVDETPKLRAVPGEGFLDEVSVNVTADRVTLQMTGNHPATLEFQFVRRKATMGNVYVTKFHWFSRWDVFGENTAFRLYTSPMDQWGILVTNSQTSLHIFRAKGKDYFEAKLLYGWDVTANYGFEMALRVNRTDLSPATEFYTESNGLFEVHRKRIGSDDKNIYPTTTKASLRDPHGHRGVSIWTDRARGVMAVETAMYLMIQRSGNFGKGNNEQMRFYEDSLSHFRIHCFNHTTEHDTEVTIRNEVDIETPIFFSKRLPENFFSDVGWDIWATRPQLDLPEAIRWTVHLLTGRSFLVRIQNIHRRNDTIFPAQGFFRTYYPTQGAMEVDFDYVTGLDAAPERPAAQEYTLAPLQFATFLVRLG